jgi:hypothetical protein
MNAFITELAWSHIVIKVFTYIGQGHRAMSKNDILSAHAFYKKAQQILSKSTHTNPDRHTMIKEISEMLANKRKSLSENLMPETHMNPLSGDSKPLDLEDI